MSHWPYNFVTEQLTPIKKKINAEQLNKQAFSISLESLILQCIGSCGYHTGG